MNEAVILQTEFKDVGEHKSQWNELLANNEGLKKILDVVNNPQGDALIFSHDDPDGITSGLIFKRLLEKKGWKAVMKNPEGFLLQPEQFEAGLKEFPNTKAVFMLDKGTLAPYNDFGKKIPLYIIDHHPSPAAPESCTYFNPSLPSYTWCSASICAHGIATLADARDEFDDFLCLVGLKGDWAIEPVIGMLSDFAKPFFIEYGMNFKNLLKLVKERPTQFDAEQRDVTCLLSRITEYVHATGGGGFSYFYHDRDESLKNVDHAECIATALETLSDKVESIKKLTSLNEFVDLFPTSHKGTLEKIFNFFLEDWTNANKTLDSSVRVLKLGDTSIYLFVGGKVPLLPMIGSIKLFELKEKAKDKFAQIIMVSSVSEDYTHVSVRGSGDKVHSGKICGELQDSMQEMYSEFKAKISGGGHPKAAECTVKTDKVPFVKVLARVSEILNEMHNMDVKFNNGNLTEADIKRSDKLGLDYMKKN